MKQMWRMIAKNDIQSMGVPLPQKNSELSACLEAFPSKRLEGCYASVIRTADEFLYYHEVVGSSKTEPV